ncbi:MAG: methyltransferase domain-containing protein [candidate division Zixibacteria bacterium]|nr:methyltransferase domain-containing protein [candidate division Zixibacteria bacterium]
MGEFFSRDAERNYEWAKEFLARRARDYSFRWDIYFSLLKENLAAARFWLDAGAGENKIIGQYESFEFKVGVDSKSPLANRKNFVRARLEALPFKPASFDFISARYVLEHLERPEVVWSEWQRILKPGGRVLVQTPNLLSYISFFPRLLPFRLKRHLLIRLFGVSPKDVFRTHHRFNRPGQFRKLPAFAVEKMVLSEDMHLHFRPLFYLSFFVHILTRLGALDTFRSAITAVLKKKDV